VQRSSLQSKVDTTAKVFHTRHFAINLEAQFLQTTIILNNWTDHDPVLQAAYPQTLSMIEVKGNILNANPKKSGGINI